MILRAKMAPGSPLRSKQREFVQTSDRTLYLAVDGGATNCRARIYDVDGTILGQGHAGPASSRLGMDTLFAEVVDAANSALADAGLAARKLNTISAGLGIAGLSLAADRAAVLAHEHPFANLAVESDAYAACLGAHQGRDGGIVIFGTGSNACAILDRGTVTVGGWGFDLGDQGGAAHVGLSALRQSLLAHERQTTESDLTRAIMQRFDNDPERAVLWAAQAIPADYGALAPEVCSMAEAGDKLAVAVMRKAGYDGDRLIQALHARGVKRIALVGGFVPHLRRWLPQKHRPYLVEAEGDALDGALIIARRGSCERPARHAG